MLVIVLSSFNKKESNNSNSSVISNHDAEASSIFWRLFCWFMLISASLLRINLFIICLAVRTAFQKWSLVGSLINFWRARHWKNTTRAICAKILCTWFLFMCVRHELVFDEMAIQMLIVFLFPCLYYDYNNAAYRLRLGECMRKSCEIPMTRESSIP